MLPGGDTVQTEHGSCLESFEQPTTMLLPQMCNIYFSFPCSFIWGKQVVLKPLWWVDFKEIRLERSTQLGPATDGDCSYIITQIGLVTPTRPGVILSSFLGPNFLNFPFSSSETQFVKMITNAKCQNLFSLSLSSQCRFSLPRSHWLYKHKLASANWWQAMRGGIIFQGRPDIHTFPFI